ncbi:MAG: M15 family metallopeptidase [Selenomonadaceae bacterium]|nr:M15 family metallopeptidase [Selenomonadaceae bacterium]
MGFEILPIDDKIFSRIDGKSYKKNCTLPIENLRYLRVLHKNLEGKILDGELICNVKIAEDLIKIFQRLCAANYPIEKISLIDNYDAEDELSMRDNNSSCFNFRFISHTKIISTHGLGLAVDINPLYNPYVKTVDGTQVIEPSTAVSYVDRKKDFPYKIVEDDICVKTFTEYGFLWGGNCWYNRKDYQHFFRKDLN